MWRQVCQIQPVYLQLPFFVIVVDGLEEGETMEGLQELRSQDTRDCERRISNLVSRKAKSEGGFFGLSPFILFCPWNVG